MAVMLVDWGRPHTRPRTWRRRESVPRITISPLKMLVTIGATVSGAASLHARRRAVARDEYQVSRSWQVRAGRRLVSCQQGEMAIPGTDRGTCYRLILARRYILAVQRGVLTLPTGT